MTWRAVVGYEGLYEVSDGGSVRSLLRSKVMLLKPRPNKDGYLRVALTRSKVRTDRPIHQLVLEAFVGPRPDGAESCHDNDVRSDNRRDNLKWDTHAVNCAVFGGDGNPGAKFTEGHAERVFDLRANGHTQHEVGSWLGISRQHVGSILLGFRRSNLARDRVVKPVQRRRGTHPSALTQIEAERVLDLRAVGCSYRRIAAWLDIGISSAVEIAAGRHWTTA